MIECLVVNGVELVVWFEVWYKCYFDEFGVVDMICGSVV